MNGPKLNRLKSNRQDLAMRTIAWVTHATRPLTTTELRHALATRPDDVSLDQMSLPSIEMITSVCAGLVTVNPASKTVSLVHYTAQEYFQRKSINYFPHIEGDIMRICTAYLRFSILDQQDLINKKLFASQEERIGKEIHLRYEVTNDLKEPQDVYIPGFSQHTNSTEVVLRTQWFRYPFISYAADSWVHHGKRNMPDSIDHIANFLSRNYHLETLYGGWSFWRSRGMHHKEHPNSGTGVHWAAYFGFVEPLEWLLEREFQINSLDSLNNPPLFYAVSMGRERTVKYLLKAGASLHQGPKYEALLFRAAQTGSAAILDILFDLGNGKSVGSHNQYKTALETTISMGHLQAVKHILARGISVDWVDYAGQTPLHMATISEDPDYPMFDMVHLLIQGGANVNVKDHHGNSPLKLATCARRGLSEESTKQDGDSFLTVELLLAKGARTEEQDVHGMGPLATAAISNAPAVIELLLKHDALIEAEDENGATPLALAVQHGALHAAQLLLQHQAAVNSRKKDGTTPLYDAVYGGQESLVKLLLSYGADISVRTQQPQIGLKVDIFFHSVIRSTTQIVQRLIQEGADLDGRAGDTRGPTALIYASKLGFLEKVRVLVEKGANVHETDEAGHTALYWATLGPKKSEGIASLLKSAGAKMEFIIPGGVHSHCYSSTQGNQTPRALSPIREVSDELNETDFIGAGGWADLQQMTRNDGLLRLHEDVMLGLEEMRSDRLNQ